MPGNSHTSVRSRQVANELRRLREKTGLTCTEVARVLGLSVSKVSRVETGSSGMQLDDVAAMLGLYQVTARKRQELLDLLRRSDEKGWWQRQAGLPQLWRILIDFESQATRIQNFEASLIPGLLQTAEYCRAVIQGINSTLTESEVDHLVATRMACQAVLTRSRAPQLVAVIDEAALHRPIGEPGVMHRQLLQLRTMARRPNITVRVVPSSVGAYVGLRGAFLILEFAEEPDLAYNENPVTETFLEEESDVAAHRKALATILAVAMSPEESMEFLGSVADEHAGLEGTPSCLRQA